MLFLIYQNTVFNSFFPYLGATGTSILHLNRNTS